MYKAYIFFIFFSLTYPDRLWQYKNTPLHFDWFDWLVFNANFSSISAMSWRSSLYPPPQRSCMGGILVSPCPSVCRQILCRTITWVVFLRIFKNFISCLLVKRGGSLSFLTIFTFAVPELLDLIWQKIGFYPMSYDILSSVSQNVLKFYQQLTGEERRVPFIFGRNNQ